MTEPSTRVQMARAMADIWARSIDVTRTRVDSIEAAAAALLEKGLDAEARDTARRAAHSLTGSAGSFGFTRASALAREAEALLTGDAPLASASVLRLATIAVELRREIDQSMEQSPEAEPTAAESPSQDRPRVIAIDDDESLLELLSTALNARGLDVSTHANSASAADLVARQRPDLVIMDLDMPAIDGIALCKALRAQPATAAVPVVFLTSHTEPEVVAQLFAAGADDYLTKPVHFDTLAGRIANRLSRVRQLHGAAAPAVESRPVPAVAEFSHTTDVAVVDDDGVLTKLLEHALAAKGYTSFIIRDGIQAIQSLCGEEGREPSVRPAVVLLDVSLPGVDGLAVLRALSRAGIARRSRVIMLTARSLESEVLQALELGAHDHIAKPFSVPVLMQRVRVALETIRRVE